MTGFRACITTAVFLAFAWNQAAWAEERLIVESIEGDKVAMLFTSKGQRLLKVGDEVHFLDSIQTSPHAAVKLRYPDDSIVVIGRDTKLEVQPKLHGTQYNELHFGQIRAQVEKAKKPDPKAPPRFMIRTRTAVMGVRGTDFVAGFDSVTQQTALHTIEGTVDLGTDEAKVMAWQGTPVNAGQAASMGTGLGTPQIISYPPAAYKKEIAAAQPEMATLAAAPRPSPEAMSQAIATAAASLNPVEPWFSLLSFRVGAVSILQNKKIAYTTGMAGWDPYLKLFEGIGVRGQLAVFTVKNGMTGTTFPAVRTGGFLDLGIQVLGPIHFEAGGGMDHWLTDTQGRQTNPYLAGNVVWHFGAGHLLEHLYAGAAKLMVSDAGDYAPILGQAGVGVRF